MLKHGLWPARGLGKKIVIDGRVLYWSTGIFIVSFFFFFHSRGERKCRHLFYPCTPHARVHALVLACAPNMISTFRAVLGGFLGGVREDWESVFIRPVVCRRWPWVGGDEERDARLPKRDPSLLIIKVFR